MEVAMERLQFLVNEKDSRSGDGRIKVENC